MVKCKECGKDLGDREMKISLWNRFKLWNAHRKYRKQLYKTLKPRVSEVFELIPIAIAYAIVLIPLGIYKKLVKR